MLVKCLVLEDGSQYDVHELTPLSLTEFVMDLVKAGKDVNAVMIKYRKHVKKVK